MVSAPGAGPGPQEGTSNTMKTFILLLVLIGLVSMGIGLRRRASQAGGSPGSFLQKLERAVTGALGGIVPPALTDDVLVLENNVIAAVFASGVRTLRTRSLLFGNTITVSISEVGERALRPVRTTVEDEILTEIVERADAEGFTLAGRPRIQFVVDRALTGFDARVRTAIDESTPVTGVDRDRSVVADQRGRVDLPVSLHWLHSGEPTFTVPADGSERVVGRSASCDWQLDSPLVSSRHLLVSVVQVEGRTALRVIDLGSTNKSTIDGDRPVTPHKAYDVGHGAVLGLGPHARVRVLIGSSVDEDTAPTAWLDAGTRIAH